MEMDMNSTMDELDEMAEGLKNLNIRTKSDEESSKAKQSQQFLQEAHGIVYGDRHEEYGDAADNFIDIAKMWTDWMSFHFNKEDVAMMMIMVKIARCHQNWTEDSLKDIVGYCTILHRFKFIDE